jgi:hypothetical protein
MIRLHKIFHSSSVANMFTYNSLISLFYPRVNKQVIKPETLMQMHGQKCCPCYNNTRLLRDVCSAGSSCYDNLPGVSLMLHCHAWANSTFSHALV